jgi:hypothetical protein
MLDLYKKEMMDVKERVEHVEQRRGKEGKENMRK